MRNPIAYIVGCWTNMGELDTCCDFVDSTFIGAQEHCDAVNVEHRERVGDDPPEGYRDEPYFVLAIYPIDSAAVDRARPA